MTGIAECRLAENLCIGYIAELSLSEHHSSKSVPGGGWVNTSSISSSELIDYHSGDAVTPYAIGPFGKWMG
jgi:hypothetical protein